MAIRSNRARPATTRALSPFEKAILWLIAAVAAVLGVVNVLFLIGRIATLASAGPTELPNVPLADPAPAALGGSSAIVSATYESVTLVVADLPSIARVALIAEAVVTTLLAIGICAAVVWLCVRVFMGRPFARPAATGISVIALLVIVAGLGGPFLRGIANTEAVAHAGYDGLALLLFQVDFAPLGWAFALIVVAAAFEIGQRLQRDNDGLV
jgi:uncharacterized protein YhhL (DUF1145 family)